MNNLKFTTWLERGWFRMKIRSKRKNETSVHSTYEIFIISQRTWASANTRCNQSTKQFLLAPVAAEAILTAVVSTQKVPNYFDVSCRWYSRDKWQLREWKSFTTARNKIRVPVQKIDEERQTFRFHLPLPFFFFPFIQKWKESRIRAKYIYVTFFNKIVALIYIYIRIEFVSFYF